MADELGAELRAIETPRQYGYPYMGFTSMFNVRMGIGDSFNTFRSGYQEQALDY